MRVALAQINPVPGDFRRNYSLVLNEVSRVSEKSADLVVFPELTLFGYWPRDLLEREFLVKEQDKALKLLLKKLPTNLTVLLGAVTRNPGKGKPYRNSALLIQKGRIVSVFHKELLPTYDIFDEARFFHPGRLEDNIFRFKGYKVLVTICEDIWAWNPKWASVGDYDNPITRLAKKAKSGRRSKGSAAAVCDLVVNLSASPYEKGKAASRAKVVSKTSKTLGAPMIYVNQVGAQDEVLFDGRSILSNSSGKIAFTATAFSSATCVFDFDKSRKNCWELVDETTIKGLSQQASKATSSTIGRGGVTSAAAMSGSYVRDHIDAITMGIEDFCEKNSLARAHLGLSGGVDSALVCVLAVRALGKENVTAIYMPGPYSSELSQRLASELATSLGIEYHELSIQSVYKTMIGAFDSKFTHNKFDLVNENIQARLRAVYLMAYSNLRGSLLLNTSNKTETAVGYTTLYGDMCGGLAPIADLLKREVYELCRELNTMGYSIAEEIFSRAPSAELREGQEDEKSLPPYKLLDESVEKIITRAEAPSSEVDEFVWNAMSKSEFKRWQAPPILRVSNHAFGRGRRYPIRVPPAHF
ncbi:MAG: NAD+ synthase [Bdellovibrionales bacterium CG10_big_fil_rev_8_21_14_0_10_45_34]|nr:MAG: NAD+ synthase [Bdellovibrionales bacterium CG10_big_fil_rev_8_21_14_0_10_45_34]